MRKQNVTFDEVYDKFAIRIIFEPNSKDEKFEAWKIYSIVTDYFQTQSISFKRLDFSAKIYRV